MEAVELDEPEVFSGLRGALHALQSADPRSVWQAPDADLGEALALIGEIRQLTEVAEVSVTREGIGRGLPAEEAWSAHDWVSVSEGRRAPRPAIRHVASVVRMARSGETSGLASGEPLLWELEAEGEASGLGAVIRTFSRGELPLGKADQLVRFHESVRRVADPDLLEADLLLLLAGAKDDVALPRSRRMHGMDEKKLAAAITMTARMLRPERDLADEDERQRASRSLTKGPGPCGMSRYTAILDPEGAAIVDAALAALSAPVKGPDGERDERSPARRRADALLTIIGRGASSPGDAPKTDKAQVLVTISLQALLGELGLDGALDSCRTSGAFGPGAGHPERGHAGGVTATGEVLAPSVVRKMACDGGVIPVVLGSEGEVLDLGRTARFFTPAQRKALWLRDEGCTFPECTMPAQWTDAHHVDWWSRGGRTDLDRAALLCERHHTRVHTLDLDATVTATGVTWHV